MNNHGHQPKHDTLDRSKPPTTGSGVIPPCRSAPLPAEMMDDREIIAHLSSEIEALTERVREFEQSSQWFRIDSAPYNQVVRVRAGEMTFLARLIPDAAINLDETSCDQWQAAREGEHPPCWSDGACWSSNVDEETSLQPTHWQRFEDEGR